jgi:hypothetical protein
MKAVGRRSGAYAPVQYPGFTSIRMQQAQMVPAASMDVVVFSLTKISPKRALRKLAYLYAEDKDGTPPENEYV